MAKKKSTIVTLHAQNPTDRTITLCGRGVLLNCSKDRTKVNCRTCLKKLFGKIGGPPPESVGTTLYIDHGKPDGDYTAEVTARKVGKKVVVKEIRRYKTIDLYLDKIPTKFRVMTPKEVTNDLPATLYVRTKDNERAIRVRRNGKLKTWKRTPGRFELPVAYGLYEHWRMTEADVAEGRLLALVPETVKYPIYFTYRNGAGIEKCLQNGSFLRVTPKGVQEYMNGDFMSTLHKTESPETQVDQVKYIEVDRELALRLIPKVCGGRGY